jgi:hypothetical protein
MATGSDLLPVAAMAAGQGPPPIKVAAPMCSKFCSDWMFFTIVYIFNPGTGRSGEHFPFVNGFHLLVSQEPSIEFHSCARTVIIPLVEKLDRWLNERMPANDTEYTRFDIFFHSQLLRYDREGTGRDAYDML